MPLKLQKDDFIVFEGDSLSNRLMGVNKSDWPYLRMMNWNDSWTNTFEELAFSWMPELNLKFSNAAVGGSTIKNMLERFELHVEALKPKWIIVTVGHNDANMLECDEFAKLAEDYLNAVGEKTDAKVVFLINVVETPTGPGEKVYYEKIAKNYETLQKLASETGNFCLDIGKGLFEKIRILKDQYEGHTIYGDGLHFNKLGNTIVAGEVLKAFGVVK